MCRRITFFFLGGEPDVAVCYREQLVVGQNFEPRWLGLDQTHRYNIGGEEDPNLEMKCMNGSNGPKKS